LAAADGKIREGMYIYMGIFLTKFHDNLLFYLRKVVCIKVKKLANFYAKNVGFMQRQFSIKSIMKFILIYADDLPLFY